MSAPCSFLLCALLLPSSTVLFRFLLTLTHPSYTVYPLRKFMPICIWCMCNLPVWLQRALARLTPVPRAQKVRRIVETMQRNSVALYVAKKAALSAGNVEAAAQVGAGNDVMSVLSVSRPLSLRQCVAHFKIISFLGSCVAQ
jgi:hypothetical protein